MLNARTWNERRIVSSRLLTGLMVSLLLLGISGCDGISILNDEENSEFSVEVPHEQLEAGTVNVDEIDRGQYGDLVEGTQTVLREEEAYASFWKKLHADRKSVPERPPVNFESQVVVAVVLGERPTGGYGVDIDEVMADEREEKIRVRYTETVPGDGCAVPQVLTSPYLLVTVDVQGGTFTFSGSEETRPC